MGAIIKFLKGEVVLVISFVLAVVSAFFVPPSQSYFEYIDFRTLALLFCLMAIVAGVNERGVLRALARALLKKCRNVRLFSLITTLLCFFSSMLITNDVALITFVPLTVAALCCGEGRRFLIPIITLQTVAANLGSMLTPVGNPQNLFLYSFYEMGIGEFLLAIAPYCALSLLLLCVSCLFLPRASLCESEESGERLLTDKRSVAHYCAYALLFVLCLLSVFRILPYYAVLPVVLVLFLLFDRKALLKVDYSLLATFLFLFLFIGNLGNIKAVSEFFSRIVVGNEVWTGILSSQIFSNVPAAILLSQFTADGYALLVGVNLGGLGTLIASMASLISFRYVAKEGGTGKYLLFFTLVNLIFLACNALLVLLVG